MYFNFVTVDVFTTRRFGGNPLAVVFDPGAKLDAARMQAMAREFNLSETSFVRPPRAPGADAEVRIFTPSIEMPWAGHPNVGTAWAMAQQSQLSAPRTYHFEELAGLVSVAVDANPDGLVEARVTAPKALVLSAAPDAATMAHCLSIDESDIDTAFHPPVTASVGFPFPMVALRSRSALARARANAAAMAESLPALGLDGIVAYSRETVTEDSFDGQPSDLSVRMFAPMVGVPEDPATGSAMASLASWLVERERRGGSSRQDGSHQMRIAQGIDMGRPSLIVSEVNVARGQIVGASVGGACVPVMSGRIEA